MLQLVLAILAVVIATTTARIIEGDRRKIFLNHVKKYSLDIKDHELEARFKIFNARIDHINKVNSEQNSFTLGLNHMSHLSPQELSEKYSLKGNSEMIREMADPEKRKKLLNGFVPPKHNPDAIPRVNHDDFPHVRRLFEQKLPPVDWVTAGAVTAVKDQANCGSCWSFAVTGAIEGAYYKVYQSLPGTTGSTGFNGLSEQKLLSCCTVNNGCAGGVMETSFVCAATLGESSSETAYPYTSGANGAKGTCDSTKASNVVANTAIHNVVPFVDVTSKSVYALASAVSMQPVSIIIAVPETTTTFYDYESGVLTGLNNCPNEDINHAVLAVGFGVWTDGTPYWKVKNSWGTSWGMDGYILIEKSADDVCGVLYQPIYPLLDTVIAPTSAPTSTAGATIMTQNGDVGADGYFDNYSGSNGGDGFYIATGLSGVTSARDIIIKSATLGGLTVGSNTAAVAAFYIDSTQGNYDYAYWNLFSQKSDLSAMYAVTLVVGYAKSSGTVYFYMYSQWSSDQTVLATPANVAAIFPYGTTATLAVSSTMSGVGLRSFNYYVETYVETTNFDDYYYYYNTTNTTNSTSNDASRTGAYSLGATAALTAVSAALLALYL